MKNEEKKLHVQSDRYSSPWSWRLKLKIFIWDYVWLLFCRWTPKPLFRWRLFWLRLFGCTVYGVPFVHQRAIIRNPWNLVLHDRCCIGDRANLYALGKIIIYEHATVAQEVYLSTGTHDFSSVKMELVTSQIEVGANAFIAARSFVLPGITIGSNSVVGACSVVTKSVIPGTICAGNPCKFIRER